MQEDYNLDIYDLQEESSQYMSYLNPIFSPTFKTSRLLPSELKIKGDLTVDGASKQ